MGFNLESFFNELISIINRPGNFTTDLLVKFRDLRKAIQEGRKYARECGHISGK